jgi:hypothetical protein
MSELDRELEELWRSADARVRAPRGFDERLFARIARQAPVRAALPLVPREAMPWWVRVAAERHVALALALAGALLAAPAWWLALFAPASAALAKSGPAFALALAPWLTPLARALAAPRAELALAVGLAPVLGWGAYALARAIERGTTRLALQRRA